MKHLLYFVKQTFVPFMYLGMFALIDFAILCIGDKPGLIALKVCLCAACLVFYVVLLSIVSYRDGQTAYKTLLSNDINRRQIIETGREYPVKVAEEYKAYKGFVSGLFVCVPLLICTIIHMCTSGFSNASVESSSTNSAGVVMSFLYMVVFAFARVKNSMAITPNMFYICLAALPIIILTMGILYILGAKKIIRQQEMIKKQQNYLHGGSR